MIKVQVPATSANLGPGYDCLGIALDEYCTVSFEVIEEGLEITGCEAAYCNEDNLIYQAFLKGLEYLNEKVSGLRMHVETNIPYARGMGSSATCIVAGLTGANALFHHKMNKYEIFDLATQMEGHPDNVAPAIFGGLTVSFMDQGKPNMIRYGVKKDLIFVTMIPDFEVSTKKAREVLPNQMSYAQAVYQMGRTAALAKAIEIGNGLIISKACNDQMQEPYRKKLIPAYDEVKTLSKDCGALTMFISGSGSTMMALTQQEEVADDLIAQLKQRYPSWDYRKLHATYDGSSDEVM
ncbi:MULTISPECIES: homoserine kinase [Bacillota]|jgi:homoserine kinase|uniref:Homoserine kinase n=2 Tax=Amedibacillus TaxID=2749846 RepID=A0A7G9GIW8_9FIRM|nr:MULTISPECIES: homoserine kinase [Bacillota]QNM10750.1 homoserine kinase [[Eubacterium] hominis]MCH4285717.1 homoserine kinase [Amedibacillus hominis]RGB53944.1 homoserine kinase [Absiella sp. AM22-9]RGB61296.1 homoserine kinase [Absiella sp. AM10-20]RGB64192.1 homoserine kinase [Absiella sp. AM09-45]